MCRRAAWTCAAALLAIATAAPAHAAASGRDSRWVGTWAAAPQALAPPWIPRGAGLDNETIRNIVRTSVGGRAVRLRLTNRFGTRPVTFDAVRVGRRLLGAAVVPGSSRTVTFRGRTRVRIPDRAEVISDPVALRVGRREDLTISLFTSQPTGAPTGDFNANQTNYISTPGNFAADEGAGAFTTTADAWFFLNAVDVLPSRRVRGLIVALGDSITDGEGSTPDANRRWPDVLARRLSAGRRAKAVVNAGLFGNNVHESSICFGDNALARLGPDVFARAGVTDVILLEGINDIIQPEAPPPLRNPCFTTTPISADQLIEHYEQIIARAHARGLRIYGGTLTPAAGWPAFTPAMELKRQEVNGWIRSSGAFDGVIDFDAVIADPADPTRMAPQYDSGDHLHPGDAGYKAMGRAAARVMRLARDGRRRHP